MIQSMLTGQEGKTLEFKENTSSLKGILRTVVAFANTAGGTLVIGVRDKTREVIGVRDILKEEERLASAFADGISPLLIPDVQIQSWRDRELLIVVVPHIPGPFFIRSEGMEAGVYIRLGSTNRKAGPDIVSEIRRLVRNVTFDESPCMESDSEAIDFRAASEFFETVQKSLNVTKYRSLGLVVAHQGREVPSYGAVLLFGKDRRRFFPEAMIRCARFAGDNKSKILDHTEIDEYLPRSIESALTFVERNTRSGIDIGRAHHRKLSEYPEFVVRESIINAVVHADYSVGGGVQLAIFDDRIELTSPGGLPFGMTMEAALSGVSCLRNRVIGRVFKELQLIEQWGSGISRMLEMCKLDGIKPPVFEEVGAYFRVTLFREGVATPVLPGWQKMLMELMEREGNVSTKRAAKLWKISDRAARERLRKLVAGGVLVELGTGPNDPHKVYRRRT